MMHCSTTDIFRGVLPSKNTPVDRVRDLFEKASPVAQDAFCFLEIHAKSLQRFYQIKLRTRNQGISVYGYEGNRRRECYHFGLNLGLDCLIVYQMGQAPDPKKLFRRRQPGKPTHKWAYITGANKGENQYVADVFAQSYQLITGSDKRIRDYEGTRRIVKTDLKSLRKEEEYFEGRRVKRYSNYYERDPRLRTEAILHHGTKCMACGFDFEEVYGMRGKGFIEVHHLRPISTLEGKKRVDPKTDMAVVCANCHRIIHREQQRALSLEELRMIIR